MSTVCFDESVTMAEFMMTEWKAQCKNTFLTIDAPRAVEGRPRSRSEPVIDLEEEEAKPVPPMDNVHKTINSWNIKDFDSQSTRDSLYSFSKSFSNISLNRSGSDAETRSIASMTGDSEIQEAIANMDDLDAIYARLPSIGSINHHLGTCKRCCFHPKGRCTNGFNCEFCHFDHDKRKRVKKHGHGRERIVQPMMDRARLGLPHNRYPQSSMTRSYAPQNGMVTRDPRSMAGNNWHMFNMMRTM